MSKNPIQDMTDIYVKKVAAFNKGEYRKNWEDLGGPTPGNYNATDDSAKLKQEALVEPKIKGYAKEVNRATRKAAFRPFNKEGFSDWRSEGLFEVIDTPTTDRKALQKVKERKDIKNVVEINPKLREAVAKMGGELLEVTDATLKDQEKEVYDTEKKDAFANQLKSKENRQKMIKKQVLLKIVQAVRAGAHQDITASYEPDIEGTVEYFYEEGINEEGFDQFIEEIGLEAFVDFVEGGAVELNEERDARRASVRAKKYDVVKKEVDKADAARKASKKGEYAPSYAKKDTDVTVYVDKPSAKKKAAPAKKASAPKKPAAPKVAPRPAAPKKPVTQKVVKAVAKVKKTQPAKKPSKQGLVDKVRTAYKKGVERHKAARERGRVPEKRATEFGKGVASGVKSAVKFAKDVKKVVGEEVGVSSSAAMEKARKEAALRKKEEEAVKKVKKVNEAKVDTGSDEEKASARNLRNTPPGGNRKFDTSVFITR